MVRASNALLTFLNICTLLISLGAIGASVYFHFQGGATSDCQKVLQAPLFTLGAAVFVVSVLGLIGSCGKVNWVLAIYLIVLFLLMIGVLAFAIFGVAVTNKGVGKVVSGMGYKEYRLGDYSHWLQKHVLRGKNWIQIRSCLVESEVCRSLAEDHVSASEFYKKKLSPTQSGCCKPPSACGFEFTNATYWTVPKTGPAVEDTDCSTWRNNPSVLCYDCKSCKAGVLANMRKEWRHLAIFSFCVFVIILNVYSFASCAKNNNKYGGNHFRV